MYLQKLVQSHQNPDPPKNLDTLPPPHTHTSPACQALYVYLQKQDKLVQSHVDSWIRLSEAGPFEVRTYACNLNQMTSQDVVIGEQGPWEGGRRRAMWPQPDDQPGCGCWWAGAIGGGWGVEGSVASTR